VDCVVGVSSYFIGSGTALLQLNLIADA